MARYLRTGGIWITGLVASCFGGWWLGAIAIRPGLLVDRTGDFGPLAGMAAFICARLWLRESEPSEN